MPDKVRCAAAKFPENRTDILVNSAGLIAHSDFVHMTEEEFDNVMNVNAKGTYFMSQAVSQFMIENKLLIGFTTGKYTISYSFAMPSEIASVAVFMASDMGNLIVGDTYYITGGSGTITMHH